jgi:hypothetical protein
MSTFFEVANLLCNLIEPTTDVVLIIEKRKHDLEGDFTESETKMLLEWAYSSLDAQGLQLERLKVCGNCGHGSYTKWDEALWECSAVTSEDFDADHFTAPPEHCQFDPSRWCEREPQ